MAPSEGVTLMQATCACTTHDNRTTCAVGIRANFARLTEPAKPPPKKPDWREGLAQAGVMEERGGHFQFRERRRGRR